MFQSRIYMPNLFILTEKNDNYSYLFCGFACFNFIPLFYNIEDIGRTFTDKAGMDIKKISGGKAELFLYGPIKPVIFTTLDRRDQNGVKYYGKKYFNHYLMEDLMEICL